MTFKPPADSERCRAVVVVAGVRGRCRELRRPGKELCWRCLEREQDGKPVPLVQEPERAEG